MFCVIEKTRIQNQNCLLGSIQKEEWKHKGYQDARNKCYLNKINIKEQERGKKICQKKQ